jgi:diguanylate cyclase
VNHDLDPHQRMCPVEQTAGVCTLHLTHSNHHASAKQFFIRMSANFKSIANPKQGSAGPLSLDSVLGHCTVVKELVEECLQDLSALEGAESIETRLNEASRVLAVVSRALAGEIKERRMLDHQFAAIQEQEATGRHRMLHDALTALPNRILFRDRLEHGLAQSLRHGRSLAVMFIDLDGFKDVNDRYGHDIGDAVLRELANRLKAHTRSGDTASRFGGDEFLYLLSDPGDLQSIAAFGKRLVRLIQEPCLVSLDETEVSISLGASIGIAISPKDGATVDKLVKSADSAMYRAKQQKSGYSFAL